MRTFTTATSFAVIFAGLTFVSTAPAQDAPAFMQDIFPKQGVAAAWKEYQSVFVDPDAALDSKTKELIGLGVAAQIPCGYCVYYHTKAAKAQGASEAEIKEAVASAALVRQWSTMLNGSQYSEEKWRQQVDAMLSGQ